MHSCRAFHLSFVPPFPVRHCHFEIYFVAIKYTLTDCSVVENERRRERKTVEKRTRVRYDELNWKKNEKITGDNMNFSWN